jgi:hypothetical protein
VREEKCVDRARRELELPITGVAGMDDHASGALEPFDDLLRAVVD